MDYMTRDRQAEVIKKFIRYSVKLAPNASRETMFNAQFDSYYDKAALEYNFLNLTGSDNSYYFLVSRPARSINPMFEGIGGKIKLNHKDSLIEYEEVFRTWKLEDKDLRTRGRYLFDRMVKEEDLSPFYSKMAGDKYIEFPDDRFYFDTSLRKWVDSKGDSISID